jgi:hypothetical protein
MAARSRKLVGKIVVERARARLPDLAPDSVEVVELVRGQTFVVVRTLPSGIVVLDQRGRLVRSRQRLAAIGEHLRAVGQVRQAVDEARLDQRSEHAGRSVVLLEQMRASYEQSLADAIQRVCRELRALLEAITSLATHASKMDPPPTERTLRRTIALVNEAAAADRRAVREVRALAALLASCGKVEDRVQRWAAQRLASADLPFVIPELDADDTAEFVDSFVTSARA